MPCRAACRFDGLVMRVRAYVHVLSGAHPRYGRNSGTSEDPTGVTRLVSADQEILHDALRPSSLTLSVIQRDRR